ncbi:hypothetical protein GUJ93_ZPchr0009g2115 [Zizania palustris]|uniref:Calmodulin binding protein C-terminal domain-containing protein n=1 Tax=Zizania palustris TaxID=103762 RepID=A0A8J5RL03_ZIZPA|nr:hypothetical protein GUJ93_ZPchr0009g2115 [Zizania palustris]
MILTDERLVLVGGIVKQDRSGIIKGIGIWELWNKEWHKVARMPHRFFQSFGEFNAKKCDSGRELYSFFMENHHVMFINSVYQIVGVTIGDHYTPIK